MKFAAFFMICDFIYDFSYQICRNCKNYNRHKKEKSNDYDSIYRLSKRQKQVLDLISLGKSNQNIADDLGLTIPTIKMHVSAIFKKLNVKNRTEAVSIYSNLEKVSNLLS